MPQHLRRSRPSRKASYAGREHGTHRLTRKSPRLADVIGTPRASIRAVTVIARRDGFAAPRPPLKSPPGLFPLPAEVVGTGGPQSGLLIRPEIRGQTIISCATNIEGSQVTAVSPAIYTKSGTSSLRSLSGSLLEKEVTEPWGPNETQ